MWNNIKTLWSEMPLFRMLGTFFGVGLVVVILRLL
jgi:hypothetical protein